MSFENPSGNTPKKREDMTNEELLAEMGKILGKADSGNHKSEESEGGEREQGKEGSRSKRQISKKKAVLGATTLTAAGALGGYMANEYMSSDEAPEKTPETHVEKAPEKPEAPFHHEGGDFNPNKAELKLTTEPTGLPDSFEVTEESTPVPIKAPTRDSSLDKVPETEEVEEVVVPVFEPIPPVETPVVVKEDEVNEKETKPTESAIQKEVKRKAAKLFSGMGPMKPKTSEPFDKYKKEKELRDKLFND